VSLTDKAIEQIRELIRTGALPPGSKLPPEQDLAAQLGLSRNLAREAVKALAVARVLEVRRGDGTYVTSLQPSLLLEGLGGAVELLQGDAGALQDLMEVRRLLEPVATALAATRISDAQLAEAKGHLDAMREARDDVEQLNAHDAAFHRAAPSSPPRATRPSSPSWRASPAAPCAPAFGAAGSTTRPRPARSPNTRPSSTRCPPATPPSARPPHCCT
jgi:GntR family transcriptional regulator, transcriptional repressor for pyruvate dehydrogenase complex